MWLLQHQKKFLKEPILWKSKKRLLLAAEFFFFFVPQHIEKKYIFASFFWGILILRDIINFYSQFGRFIFWRSFIKIVLFYWKRKKLIWVISCPPIWWVVDFPLKYNIRQNFFVEGEKTIVFDLNSIYTKFFLEYKKESIDCVFIWWVIRMVSLFWFLRHSRN